MPTTRSKAAAMAQEAKRRELKRQATQVVVRVSDTGKGVHIKWIRPQPIEREATEVIESDDANYFMRSLSSLSTLTDSSTSSLVDARFVTPVPQQPFESNTILYAPKKAMPLPRTPNKLQRHSERIGNPRLPIWDSPGIRTHITSDPQRAEQIQYVQEYEIAYRELTRLRERGRMEMEQWRAMQESMEDDEGDNDGDHEMIGTPYGRNINGQRLGPHGTEIIGSTAELGSPFNSYEHTRNPSSLQIISRRGPNGEKLGLDGRQLTGPTGTLLFFDDSDLNTEEAKLRRGRLAFGPNGTHLIPEPVLNVNQRTEEIFFVILGVYMCI